MTPRQEQLPEIAATLAAAVIGSRTNPVEVTPATAVAVYFQTLIALKGQFPPPKVGVVL